MSPPRMHRGQRASQACPAEAVGQCWAKQAAGVLLGTKSCLLGRGVPSI